LREAVSKAATLNSFELLDAAIVCRKAARSQDQNFFSVIGRARAAADIKIFKPNDRENSKRTLIALQLMFTGLHELMAIEPLVQAGEVDALVSRVRKAGLVTLPAYTPGWHFETNSKTDVYREYLVERLELEIWSLRNFALRMQNKEFFAAAVALNKSINSSGRPNGEIHSLRTTLDEIGKSLPELPSPTAYLVSFKFDIYQRLNKQEGELAKMQIAVAFGGTVKRGVKVFKTETEFRQSSVAKAFSDDELNAALSKVDFVTQLLFAVNIGETRRASGQILFGGIYPSWQHDGHVLSVRVGVLGDNCFAETAKSYPFFLVAFDPLDDPSSITLNVTEFQSLCGEQIRTLPLKL
jgi:hypothetical protein